MTFLLRVDKLVYYLMSKSVQGVSVMMVKEYPEPAAGFWKVMINHSDVPLFTVLSAAGIQSGASSAMVGGKSLPFQIVVGLARVPS